MLRVTVKNERPFFKKGPTDVFAFCLPGTFSRLAPVGSFHFVGGFRNYLVHAYFCTFLFITLVAVMPPGFTRGFDNNRYVLSWRFDDQADMMYYHLRVKTTGWVGFGFAEKAPNMMIDYDVVVAGFSNGRGYLFVS